MVRKIVRSYLSGVYIILILKVNISLSVDWDKVKCSSDVDQNVPGGPVSMGRFPWLGVIQHNFYLAGKSQFAITTGILIHPGYAVAAAEDIAKIPRNMLSNNTKFIVWHSEQLKFAVDVVDYILHPEYEEKITFATMALLELYTAGETGIGDLAAVVLPVCLPMAGSGTFDILYGARISDDSGEINKEAMEMDYIPNKECDEFYYNAQLTYEMMKPRRQFCASVQGRKDICVWDAGVAIISKQSWGHWMLLGFSMRGPGCGAPGRYVSIHDFMPWIDAVLSKIHQDDTEIIKINFRRHNPFEFIMYKADVKLPTDQGQCEKHQRGTVVYKELAEVISTKNFGQGYYYLSVMQIASFMCVKVIFETQTRTNTAVWVEHMCHRDVTGLHPHGVEGPDFRRTECFQYFRSNAYVEFRFYFTFRAAFELTIFGKLEKEIMMPDPNMKYETTLPWAPTASIINWDNFYPYEYAQLGMW